MNEKLEALNGRTFCAKFTVVAIDYSVPGKPVVILDRYGFPYRIAGEELLVIVERGFVWEMP